MIPSDFSTRLFSAVALCCIAWFFINASQTLDIRLRQTTDAGIEAPAAAPQGEKLPTALATADAEPELPAMTVRERSLDADRRAYVARFSTLAISEMHLHGIPASITLAQGLLESAAGRSTLATEANNHFGIKCFSRSCKSGHCMNRTDDTHKDFFVRYTSAWASFRAHSKLLISKYKTSGDYRQWAQHLQARGYATSRTYAADLIRLIRLYRLDRYDRQTNS